MEEEVVGEGGQGGAKKRGGGGLELSLAAEELSHVDVGQAGLIRYLPICLARFPLHGLKLSHHPRLHARGFHRILFGLFSLQMDNEAAEGLCDNMYLLFFIFYFLFATSPPNILYQ